MKQTHDSKLVLVLFAYFVTRRTKYPSPEGDVIWLISVCFHSPVHELFYRPTSVLNSGTEAVMSGLSVSMVYLGNGNNLEAYDSDALRVEREVWGANDGGQRNVQGKSQGLEVMKGVGLAEKV